jgi:hypothetical protein
VTRLAYIASISGVLIFALTLAALIGAGYGALAGLALGDVGSGMFAGAGAMLAAGLVQIARPSSWRPLVAGWRRIGRRA